MHREPQPVKLYTFETIYRYGAPGRRAASASTGSSTVEAIGSDDPAVDAEVIQLYDTLLAPARRHASTAWSSTRSADRECRPAYLDAQLQPWLAEHVGRARRGDAREGRARTRCARSTTSGQAGRGAGGAATRRRRSATRSATPAASTSPTCAAYLDAYGVEYELVPTLVRGLDYYSRTTWEFVGPLENENATLSGGGRYDGLAEEIGGPPTPGVGFGAGIERLLLALEAEGATAERPGDRRLLRCSTRAPRASSSPAGSPSCARRGVSADTDYAGRSLKGQLTQAGRLGAATIVVVDRRRATLRRPGSADEDVTHDELPARLAL